MLSARISTLCQSLLVAIIALLAIYAGLHLRHWLYASTDDVRFNFDINNAWRQGTGVVEDAKAANPNAQSVSFPALMRAYLHRYDISIKNHPEGDYLLDYPPARLLIMTVWVWNQTDGGKPEPPSFSLMGMRFGSRHPRLSPAELAWPLLSINSAFELTAAVGAYFLALAVLKRNHIKYAILAALPPALLLWFNPAVLLDAHVWPQWDAWILPFWLWAGFFAVTRHWLAAGLCLGVGVMFKGQIFICLPFFLLWPLLQFRLRFVIDQIAGILLGIMLCVTPWMLQTTAAKIAVAGAVVFAVALLRVLPRNWRIFTVASIAGVAILLCGLFLGGDLSWWTVGFQYGVNRYMAMTMGTAPNLASFLEANFGYGISDVLYTINWTHPAIHFDITIQYALGAIYALLLILSSAAAARQDCRNDRRLLLTFAAPWVAMFACLTQMHERYLLWGSAILSLAAAVSLGSTIIFLAITFCATLPIVHDISGGARSQQDYPLLTDFIRHAANDIPPTVILLALILVYLCFTKSDSPRAAPAEAKSPPK